MVRLLRLRPDGERAALAGPPSLSACGAPPARFARIPIPDAGAARRLAALLRQAGDPLVSVADGVAGARGSRRSHAQEDEEECAFHASCASSARSRAHKFASV